MNPLIPFNILSNLLNLRYFHIPNNNDIKVADGLSTSKVAHSKNFDAKKPAFKPSVEQKNKTLFLNNPTTHYYQAKDTEDLKRQFCIGVEMPIAGVASGNAKLEHGVKDKSTKTYIVGTYEAFNTKIENLTIDDLTDEAKEKLHHAGGRYFLTPDFIEEYGDGYISSVTRGVYYYVDARICDQEKKIDAGVGIGIGPAKGEAKIGYSTTHGGETFKADCVGFVPTDQSDYSALSEDFRKISTETAEAYKNNQLINNTVSLKITKTPWNHIQGIEIYYASDEEISDEFTSIKQMLNLIAVGDYDRFKGSVPKDFTKIVVYLLTRQPFDAEKEIIKSLFKSPIIFPLFTEILKQSTTTKAESFLQENTADINSFNGYQVFYDLLLSLKENPKHYNIYSKSEKEKIRMDKTNQGWVRLPILIENPNQSASWLFKPVNDGKYFLISSEKWPNCYLYLENNLFLCRARGWTPNDTNTMQQEPDYEQALWIITPQISGSEILYKISPKKWPQMSLYIRKLLIDWVDAMVVTNDNIPTNRGLFYLHSTYNDTPVSEPLSPQGTAAGSSYTPTFD